MLRALSVFKEQVLYVSYQSDQILVLAFLVRVKR
jgi:hypothetical protein